MRWRKKLSSECEGSISKLDTPKAGITVYVLSVCWLSCPEVQWVEHAPSSPIGIHGGVDQSMDLELLSEHWLGERGSGRWAQRVTPLQHCRAHPLINLFPKPAEGLLALIHSQQPGKILQGAEIQAGWGMATALPSAPHQACSWRPPEFLPKRQSDNFISKSLPLYHSACLKCSDTFPRPG